MSEKWKQSSITVYDKNIDNVAVLFGTIVDLILNHLGFVLHDTFG